MAACFRYIVNDVNAAIDFYTKRLGFKLEMHPAPPFCRDLARRHAHLPDGAVSSWGRSAYAFG